MLLNWDGGRRQGLLEQRTGQIQLTVNRLQIINCDARGRFMRAVLGPSTFRRSYDNLFLEVHSEAVEGERFHVPRRMEPDEARRLMSRVVAIISAARDAAWPTLPAAVKALDTILAWDVDRLQEDGRRFFEIYRPVRILPPDQQWALVIQPESVVDLDDHLAAVMDFFGPAISMRRTIYLDGRFTPDFLSDLLPGMAARLRLGTPGGFSSVGAPLVSAVALQRPILEALRKLYLTRVYLTDDGADADGLRLLHESKLQASLLVEAPRSPIQAEALAQRLNPLPLLPGDAIYVMEPLPYPEDAAGRLSLRRVFHHFREALIFPRDASGPIVSHFPVGQTVY